ncbi:MAG: DUF1573 domain-containing protein [bacterium]|nr:DUF1573 domain-containing protein [bacterium]
MSCCVLNVVSRQVLAGLVASVCLSTFAVSPAWAQPSKDAPAPSTEKRSDPAPPQDSPGKPPAPLPAPDGTVADEAVTGPRATIAAPHKDFGELWEGVELTHSFLVQNTGDAKLEILRVKASCGCTSTGYDKQVDPGASGKVNVKLKTKNFNGKFAKTVTVTTNDPNNSTIRLKLSGVAKQKVSVEPRTAAFTQVQPDQVLNRAVQITNNSDEPMTLTLDEGKTGPFSAVLKEIEPGQKYTLDITGNPPYKPKLNRATFHLKTNLAAKPKLTIPCSAYVPPRLELRPAKIQLRTAQNRQITRTVRLINSGPTDIQVKDLTVDDSNVTATLREQKPGRDYAIELTFPKGYMPPEKGTQVVVATDDAKIPQMVLPITKIAPRKPRPKPGEKLVGKPAPKIELETVSGQKIAIGEPGDDVLVLEFYVSWCGFCKRSLPNVEAIHQKYKGKGVRVLALNEDVRTGKRGRTVEKITEHFEGLNLTMERILDPDKKAGNLYFAQSYPAMYLIGKNGVVEAAHFGAKRNLVDLVSKDLDKLLAGESLQAARPAVTKITSE